MDALWYTSTSEGDDTATEAELTTTVNQQTSASDRDSSTVTADVTTVTDSQTLTGASYTPAVVCRPAHGEHTNITSSSAIAEGPRDGLSQLKSCQVLHNCTKNHI